MAVGLCTSRTLSVVRLLALPLAFRATTSAQDKVVCPTVLKQSGSDVALQRGLVYPAAGRVDIVALRTSLDVRKKEGEK